MNEAPSGAIGTSEQALRALNEAALSISRDLALDRTLQQIVDSAGELVSARYAAIGVFDSRGRLSVFLHSGISEEQADRIEYCPLGKGLLGALLEGSDPIRVDRIGADHRSVGFPGGHPPMTTFLGVPILAGEEVLGNLYLTDKLNGDPFTEQDEGLMQVFASHAAVAIKNARRYEKVGELAVGEERSRLGMDLHDSVIQSIYAVGLTLETAQMILDQDSAQTKELLSQAVQGLNEAIRDIRNLILDLRPRRFEGDLNEGLDRLAREFQANAMVRVKIEAKPELAAGLRAPIARALFLTAQEALANVARHARASSVQMDLRKTDQHVLLTISDNGRGFEVRDLDQALGHGLANMKARAEELGGTFVIESSPGMGTTVRLSLPTRK